MSGREGSGNLHVGGQAVIEGVMMRSPRGLATAVRSDDGKIVVKAEEYISLTQKSRLAGFPVIRGAVAMIETFIVAVKALSFSADHAASAHKVKDRPKKAISALSMAAIVTGAFALGFIVFFYLPLLITEMFGFESGILFNLVDGILRLLFLFLYIIAITRWKDMRRIFEYHGAEHKAIFAFEDDPDVTAEKALESSRFHPRCSTSFLLIVVIVSVLVFIFLGRPETIADRLIRFSFIPVIAGISYEVLKLSARKKIGRKIGFLLWPGLFLQRFTTQEPSADQVEVAIAALKACLDDNLLARNGIIN
ncbi:MAG: DUF1385 domain-containing protein [Candidatus Krumholzibacteriota bacterium]|nr:DUF1385 domain-containing protein [Candidatus Krumholzibacteriota bacterium]